MPVLDDTETQPGDLVSVGCTNTSADSCSLPIVVHPHPFSQQHEIRHVPAGLSVTEILHELGYQLRPVERYAVRIDGVPVPEDQWEWIHPAQQHVAVVTVPRGGGGGGSGKNIASIFIGVALIAASILVPALAPEAFAFVFTAAGVGSAALGVGTALVLGGLAGLISPRPNLPSLNAPAFNSEPQQLVNSITGTQNRANPFGAIPRVLGTHRVYPTLAASPFTEIVGNEQYLVMLFCFGYGRVDISDEKIGNTALTSFNNVTSNNFEGTTSTPSFSIYTNDVDEDRFNILLTNAGGWQTRTTAANVDQISVDLVYPKGMVAYDANGVRITTSVSVDIEYRVSSPPGSWTAAGTVTVTDKTSGTLRKTFKWSVSTETYDVRTQRTTADSSSDTVFDEVRWAILRSFKLTSPINTDKVLAYKELRIQASNQLNGTISEYNALVKSYLQTYNGSSWVDALTNNPAWCYASPLIDAANESALATSRLNASDLKDWADWCDTNSFTFNRVIDAKTTVFEIMKMAASAGRASFHIQDGLYTVIREISQSTPIQHFSKRNIISYSGEKYMVESPHALRIPFLNEDIDYAQDERIVYDDGYDENNATVFEKLEFRGVTNSDQVWKLGRYHIAQARLRPETHYIDTDLEFLECTRGDLVELVHDVPKFGLGSARITQVDLDGSSNCTDIYFDEKWVHQTGESYAVRIRKSDGTSLLEDVDLNVGTNKSVTFTTPIAAANPQPEVGDLVMFGLSGSTTVSMLISSIEPRADLTAKLTLVDQATAVLTADTGPIPAFSTNITQPAKLQNQTPTKPIMGTIRSDESVLVRDPDGSLRCQMAVPLEIESGTGYAGDIFYQVQYRITGSSGPWTITPLVPAEQNEVVIGGVEDGETYDVRARSTNGKGLTSLFTTTVAHTIVGKSNPPPDVTTFMVTRQADGTREFEWTLSNPPLDLAGYKIRWKLGTGSYTWDDLTDLHSGLLQASTYETNQLAAGEYTLAIKAVDTSGNESTNEKQIVSNLGNPRLAGALLQINCRALGWPGTKTSCRVKTNGDLSAVDTKTWADFNTDGVQWSGWTSWVRSPADPIQYDHDTIDLGAILTFTLLVTASGNGTFTITEAHSDDDISYSSYAAITGQITARYIKVRVSVTTADSSAPNFENILIIPDAAALVEDLQDIDTSTLSGSTGDRRFALEKNFSIITSVNLALQNVGAGWSWTVIDKSVSLGPRVQIFDSGDSLADATVDAVIRGIESNT